MAAGLGFKDFVTGEVLTAADVDGYLMQGVWVFASAAARDAAVTSPQEGNFAYLKDTNVTTYYTGSAWANLDTTGMTNPMTTTGDTIYSSSGSTPARLGIGTTGQILTVAGGIPSWATPAAGASGLTLVKQQTIGSSVTSVTVSDAFTSSYDNYRILISGGSATNTGSITMKLGSTATGYYLTGFYQSISATPSVTAYGFVNGSSFNVGYQSANGIGSMIDMNMPYAADETIFSVKQMTLTTGGTLAFYQGYLNNTTSYTAFTLTFEYAQTGGEIRVYGYQNS